MDHALIMVIMVMRKSWMKVCVQHTRPSIKVISEAFRKEQTAIITLHLMREDILERKFKTFGLISEQGRGFRILSSSAGKD